MKSTISSVAAVYRHKTATDNGHYESLLCGCEGKQNFCPHCDGTGVRKLNLSNAHGNKLKGINIYIDSCQKPIFVPVGK